MKQKRFLAHDTAAQGKPETYRIINAAGKEVTSFTLNDEQPGVTLHLERPGLAIEAPVKRLEREAWSYYEALVQTLDKIDAINPAAALSIFGQMFTDDKE